MTATLLQQTHGLNLTPESKLVLAEELCCLPKGSAVTLKVDDGGPIIVFKHDDTGACVATNLKRVQPQKLLEHLS